MQIRVLTLNVWNNDGPSQRTSLINQELKRLQPDLISFQEVVRSAEKDQLAELTEGLGFTTTHQADMQAYEPPFFDRFGGAAIATKLPHSRLEVVDLRKSGSSDVPWATMAVSLALPDLGELLFIAASSSWRLNAEAARERQAFDLVDLDSRHRRELPTIIAGDFNASPESASIRFLTGLQSLDGRSVHYHDAWAIGGQGPGWTWSDENPNAKIGIEQIVGQPAHRRRIDYVFVGGWDDHPRARAKVLDARLAFDEPLGGLWASDHFGVLVTLDVTKNQL
jgi:endonuclease/exonuclease/phosphatase family metal-dependent hydrolase